MSLAQEITQTGRILTAEQIDSLQYFENMLSAINDRCGAMGRIIKSDEDFMIGFTGALSVAYRTSSLMVGNPGAMHVVNRSAQYGPASMILTAYQRGLFSWCTENKVHPAAVALSFAIMCMQEPKFKDARMHLFVSAWAADERIIRGLMGLLGEQHPDVVDALKVIDTLANQRKENANTERPVGTIIEIDDADDGGGSERGAGDEGP